MSPVLGPSSRPAIGVVCSRDLPEESAFEGERFAEVPRFARTVAEYVSRAARSEFMSRLVGEVARGDVDFWAAAAEEARFDVDSDSEDDAPRARGVVAVARIDAAAALDEIVAVVPCEVLEGVPEDMQTYEMCVRGAGAPRALLRSYDYSIYPRMADRFFADPGFCLELVAASGSAQVLEDPRVDCCAELLEELPRGLPVLARFPPAVLLEAAPELLREIVAALPSEYVHVPAPRRTRELTDVALAGAMSVLVRPRVRRSEILEAVPDALWDDALVDAVLDGGPNFRGVGADILAAIPGRLVTRALLDRLGDQVAARHLRFIIPADLLAPDYVEARYPPKDTPPFWIAIGGDSDCSDLAHVPEHSRGRIAARLFAEGNFRAFPHIPAGDLTEDLCRRVVARCGVALKCVPRHLRTAEVCAAAVAEDGEARQYVPQELRSSPALQGAREQGPQTAPANGVMGLLAFNPKGVDGYLTGSPHHFFKDLPGAD